MRRMRWTVAVGIMAAATALAEAPTTLPATHGVDAIVGTWHVLGDKALLATGTRLEFTKQGDLKVVGAGNNDTLQGGYRVDGSSLRFTGEVGALATIEPVTFSLPCNDVMLVYDAKRPLTRAVLLRVTSSTATRNTMKTERAAAEAHAVFTASVAAFYRGLVSAHESNDGDASSAVGRERALERYDALVDCLKEMRNALGDYRAVVEMLARRDKEQQAEMIALQMQVAGLSAQANRKEAAEKGTALHTLWRAATANQTLHAAYEATYQSSVESVTRAVRTVAGLKAEISESYKAAGLRPPFLDAR